MSSLIILRHVRVENANAIAGFTYGFPAITHFLGYTHALSRKLQGSHGLVLDGCSVVCHQHQVQCYQPSGWGDYVFAQSRNPLTKEGVTAPIMEEGKVHITVSLLMECKGLIPNGETGVKALQQHLESVCPAMRMAGGTITSIRKVEIVSIPQAEEERKRFNRRQLRQLLPGFVLLDRSSLLKEHFHALQAEHPETELIDAWLDFVALKAKAEPLLEEGEVLSESTKVEWHYIQKPHGGWLVPICTGYRAISPLYEAGTVANSRDNQTPFRFVESVFGIGEWRSPHRIKSVEQLFWRYHYDEQDGYYLCKNNSDLNDEDTEQAEDYSF
ncbi:MAG TPA: type I-F CRISPR-associated protein Csy2 [Deltaproteobacteria bacterium]|nr:type I-F CRISPR-associated protein Csy2 [Deltaproteobacteria bacterium]